jgi:fructose-bisphosphate aldolase class I
MSRPATADEAGAEAPVHTEEAVVEPMSPTQTAAALVAPGRGILAADESTPTIAKRLASVGLESTEALRQEYRELLFTTPGLAEHVSGVILFDETIRQRAADGTPFPEVLRRAGMIPGIKVDRGTKPLAGFPDEVVTEGLDGLRDRLLEYAALGARFAKWRAVIRVGRDRPSDGCIDANAHALARFAALAQEAGLTPIVEPEVLMDGAHSIDRCGVVTRSVLRAVYDRLARQRVVLDGTLLKPNMVLPGSDSPERPDDDTIAAHTLGALRDTVPASVLGIVFLSGGQTPEQATSRLSALNRQGAQPWQLSFSYGRALQEPVLKAWSGSPAHREEAQEALRLRASLNGAARYGQDSMAPGPGSETADLEAASPGR